MPDPLQRLLEVLWIETMTSLGNDFQSGILVKLDGTAGVVYRYNVVGISMNDENGTGV